MAEHIVEVLSAGCVLCSDTVRLVRQLAGSRTSVLVIELGIVLLVLLGWRFFLGNILVGIVMIRYAYLLTSVWFPSSLAEGLQARGWSTAGAGHDP